MYKLLIIEDEEMIRKGLMYSIDWFKYNCVVIGEATNGLEGVNQIKKLEPDIVLLDINMPIMTGLELMEEVSNNYSFSTIILSGYNDFTYAKKAIDYGVETYLLKPIEKEKLLEALEKAKDTIELKRKYELIEKKKVKIEGNKVLNVSLWNSSRSEYNPAIHRAIKYIEEKYKEKITMEDLVDITGMSATYLNNQFKDSTTFTFNEYLNRYRIQKSIELIQSTDDKISNIALDVGFTTYRYFVTVFKRYTGIIPSEFERNKESM